MPPRHRSDPVSRVSCARACARLGARIAAARFARLIARARGRCRTHFACRLNRGRSAPDRHGREAAPDASSLGPIIPLFLKMQVPNREILHKFQEQFAINTGQLLDSPLESGNRRGRGDPRLRGGRRGAERGRGRAAGALDTRRTRYAPMVARRGQRTSTFSTMAAALSPAAQPVKRPYPPPLSASSSISSSTRRMPVGPCGWPKMREEP